MALKLLQRVPIKSLRRVIKRFNTLRRVPSEVSLKCPTFQQFASKVSPAGVKVTSNRLKLLEEFLLTTSEGSLKFWRFTEVLN